MAQDLLVGIRGWEVAAWQGSFYPEELPEEWRFSYYSNLYRSVLVPGEIWDRVDGDAVAQWQEDSDPEFRFVHELPPALSRPGADAGDLERFQALTAPVATRTAAWLLRIGVDTEPDTGWLADHLAVLGDQFPVCVDLPTGPWRLDPVRAAVESAGASTCWHPETEPEPADYGGFLVALMDRAELKTLRPVVETLGRWMAPARGAGLFFEATAGAPRLAEETRILAELLGV